MSLLNKSKIKKIRTIGNNLPFVSTINGIDMSKTVVYKIEEDPSGKKTITGMQELFWLYFPHCRFIFNNYFLFLFNCRSN